MFGLKQWRRRRIRSRPFPEHWQTILDNDVAYYHRLSASDRAELCGHIQVFLREKRFEGCGGLEITDAIRVIIAAEACILLLHRRTDYYPSLHSILVYPHSYAVRVNRRLPGGVVAEGVEGRWGESWYRGAVVLAWDEVSRTAHAHPDARNVVFHEFTHQLDSESGANEGVPLLESASLRAAWARVLGREYRQLLADIAHRRPTDIDEYGAQSPAEFFAVLTEEFFEQPLRLRQRHPDLYGQLAEFFRQDPALRFSSAASG